MRLIPSSWKSACTVPAPKPATAKPGWRAASGNLHEQSIQTIWRQSRELAEVRRLAVEVKQAVSQHGPLGFGFCPGLAEQETGDPAGLYPAARRLLELRQPPAG